MIYIQTHNRWRFKKYTIISCVLVFIVVIGVVQIVWPLFFSTIFTAIARPFWRAEFAVKSGALQSQQSLVAENEELRLQIEQMKIQLANSSVVENENLALKSILGRPELATTTLSLGLGTIKNNKQNQNHRVIVPILARPPLNQYDEFIIDGGSDFGFKIDDKVYASGDVLIGKISQVLGHTAKVKLLSSPGNSFNVLIGPSNIAAIAIGRGGGQYYAELPIMTKISVGDVVTTTALDQRLFGTVQAISQDPIGSFKKALISSSVNIYQLRWVIVEL